jgi:pimeloyl-ACP methyl ester carboxylesterase
MSIFTNYRKRAGWVVIMSILAMTIGSMAAPIRVHAAANGTCNNVTTQVSLVAGLPANQTISGTLCTPQTWAEGPHQVDVLIHGATYNRAYWDWPVTSSLYSYASKTLQAGRATFAYDRIGSGSSSRPLGALVTLNSDAYALHQIITWLRTTHNYPQVNTISHSLGSSVAIIEAGTYTDADRVILTGVLHTSNISALLNATTFYPAMLDPAFFGLLDPTYLTTQPNTRGNLFYHTNADPAVIAYDESHKDVLAVPELAGAAVLLQAPAAGNISTHITAPVLIAVGQNDTLVCSGTPDCSNPAAIVANEAPYFTSAASVSAASFADTGHDIPLHPTANSSFASINQWIATH